MCAVVAAVFSLAPAYCGGNKLIKLPIPANQELDIFVVPQQRLYELFQPAFYFQYIFDYTMPKEADSKYLHFFTPLLVQILYANS